MSEGSGLMLFLRVGTSLAIVLGMIWVAARVVRRRVRPGLGGRSLDVVARRSLGRRTSLMVVEAGGRSLLVGVTDHQVNLVADVTGPDVNGVASDVTTAGAPLEGDTALDGALDLRVDAPTVAEAGTRGSLVDTLRELTVRRA